MVAIEAGLSEDEQAELEELLVSYGEQIESIVGEEVDGVLDLSELDGFFTALVSGPEVVPPSQWWPVIWGGAPLDIADPAALQHLWDLLLRFMNGIAGQLMAAPAEFEPLFNVHLVEGREVVVVDEWCQGYARGVNLREAAWEPAWAAMPEAATTLSLFVTPEGWDAFEKMDAATQAGFCEMVPAIARGLHAYWLNRRRGLQQPIRREVEKVGRNDPCPCGSGKKYKQCCLH